MDVYFRGFAAQALGNLGETTQPYVKDIRDILKNEQVNAEVRGFVAQALGNLGEAAQPYFKDILHFLLLATFSRSKSFRLNCDRSK